MNGSSRFWSLHLNCQHWKRKKRTNGSYQFNGKFYFNLVFWFDLDFSYDLVRVPFERAVTICRRLYWKLYFITGSEWEPSIKARVTTWALLPCLSHLSLWSSFSEPPCCFVHDYDQCMQWLPLRSCTLFQSYLSQKVLISLLLGAKEPGFRW